MTDLNVSMFIRLMDQFSGPGQKIKATMRDLKAGAREFRTAFGKEIKSGFSTANIEAAMKRSEARISRAQGRFRGAVGMALTLAAPVIVSGNFEEKLIDFGNLAEIDAERLKKLKGELNALRAETGMSNGQLLEGLSTYVGKGMGLDESLASLRSTGRSAKATKSQFDEMANSGFAVMDNLKVTPELLDKAFNVMALSGKEGSFELQAMARKFPEITAGAKSLKMEGIDAVASLSAALQIAMKSAGSEDQAATNMANFLGKITAPDTVKKFAKFGVNIEKEMQIAAKKGSDPLMHMLKVIEQMTGGDSFKMGQLFQDKQVLDFLRAVIPNMEEYERIKAKAAGAEGVIDKDYERVMEGFNESMKQFKNSVTNLLGASGAILPVFTEILQSGTAFVNTLAAWTTANPELTATIVKATVALLAFGVASRVVGYGMALTRGGLISTAASFLRFNAAGKNVSTWGRMFRRIRIANRRTARSLGLTQRMLRAGLWFGGWGIKPLVWTGKLIPKIAWLALAGGLRWSKLIIPLKWGAKLLPAIGWTALAGKLGWRALIVPLKWGARLIPGIGWALLAGELAWHLIIKPLGWDEYITADNLGAAWDKLRGYLKWTAIVNPIMWVSFIPGDTLKNAWKALNGEISWSDVADQIDWAEMLHLGLLKDTWDHALTALKWGEFLSPINWSVFIESGALSTVWRGLKGELSWKEIISEIDWSAMLGIDRLKAVWKEAMASLSWPSWLGGADEVQLAGPSITKSMPPNDPTVPHRPGNGATPPPTVQHNTFENKPEISVKVPVHITKQQSINLKEIARKTGADTERAVNRALDDAALSE